MTDLARRAPARLAVLLLAVVVVAAGCLPFNSQEQHIHGSTNQLRIDHGLPALPGHDHLTAKAREWAGGLAARGELRHADLHQLGMGFSAVAENIGYGHSVEDVFRRLRDSPAHRANMLDSRWTHSSVGTARAKDGSVYVVQLFWRG